MGEETGLLAVLFSFESQEIQIIDLDSGELRDLGRFRGQLRGAIGSTLVLTGPRGPVLLDLSQADPERQAIEIGGRWPEIVGIYDEQIWLLQPPDDPGSHPVMAAYDTSGAQLDEIELPVAWWRHAFAYNGRIARPTETFFDPAGGLYRRGDDGFRLVAEGEPIAVGQRIAAVRSCDEGLVCDVGWFDLTSSRPIDLPVPPVSAGDGAFQIIGGDRWLLHTDWESGQRLIEIASGEVRRELGTVQGWFGPGTSTSQVSDDGRWLIDRVGGEHVVVDLDNGREHALKITGLRFASGFFTSSDD